MTWQNTLKILKKYRKKLLTALAMLVVFVTTYALIIPAITIDKDRAKEEPGIEIVEETQNTVDESIGEEMTESSDQPTQEDLIEPVLEEPTGKSDRKDEEVDFDTDELEVWDDVTEEDQDTEEISMPEMTLKTDLDELEKSEILVEAEAGSLPEGTRLEVKQVKEKKVLKAIEDAVDTEEIVDSIVAYDISFISPEGEKIEPEKDVRVSMKSPEVEDASDTLVVHVEDDTLYTSVVDQVDEETKEDEVVFESDEFSVYGFVFTQKLTASVLTSEGEAYTINVYLDEESRIPEGAELKVTELAAGSKEYESHLNESKEAIKMKEDEQITFARFFDIEIQKDGKKLEPETPAKVEIIYDDPMDLKDGRNLNVVHFADKGIEVIDDLKVEEDGKQITYEQESFSVTGTLINGPLNNGQQGMIIVRDNGADYIVLSDGTLEPVTKVDWNTFTTDNPMIWKYTHNTYYHETRAYDFASNQTASDFYYSYINAKEEDGIGDDDETNINPEDPLNRPAPYGHDGRKLGDYSHRTMWSASATTLDNNHHLRNTYQENGQYYYIGVERGPDGKPTRITGRNSEDNAAEIYFASTTIPSLPDSMHLNQLPPQNRVNHIDISIKGTTTITYPLTRGYTYYYEDGSSYTPTEKTTVTLSQEVGIKTDDMRKATISAFTKDSSGTRHPIDDVFYITGYSANAETQYSTDQVRIEGPFKVTTTDSTNWSERIKSENRIYYAVDASKPVEFMVTDPQGRQLYDENHKPVTVTVNVNLSASFDYWDERNECPPVKWTLDSWRAGDIPSHGMSGMDFVLGGDTNLNTLEIIKMVEDQHGNLIEMQQGTKLEHDFDIYQRVNQQWQQIDTKTAEVGSGGVGFTSDYGVPDGRYVIREQKETIPEIITDKNGDTWIYKETYFDTEGKGDGRRYPNPSGDLYESRNGEVGTSNRDLQFTCHNIYVKKTSVEVEKKWYQYGQEIEAPENAKITVTLGRYKKIAQGEDPDDPDDPIDPEVPEQIKANIDIYQSNYGHRTYFSNNNSFYAGQTLLVTLNKRKSATVSYTVGGQKTTLSVEANNETREDYSFQVTVPADGILSIPLDDPWGDVRSIRVQSIGNGQNVRRLAKKAKQTETITWSKEGENPEGYQVDKSFVQPVILSDAEGWSRSISNLDGTDENGNEYLYYIAKIVEENVPAGTSVEVQQPYTTNGEESLMVHDIVPPDETEVSFTKRWYDENLQTAEWPKDPAEIQVTMKRYKINNGQTEYDASYEKKFTLTKENGEGYSVEVSGKDYIYTISDLEKYDVTVDGTKLEWIYTFSEEVPFGYHVKYINKDASDTSVADHVTDQGVIENHLDVYQLPHTGGPGTFIYTLAGGVLILFAICLLLWRQKRERRSLLK